MLSFAKEVSKQFDLMRAVSIRFFHAQEASSDSRKKTGKAYNDLVCQNFVFMPEEIDTMDPDSFETLRHVWLESIDRQEPYPQNHVNDDETVLGAFVRLLQDAQSKVSVSLMKTFVEHAKYPVPYEFSIVLPKHDKDLRKEVIGLIPFVKTRDMLLRLEDKLELPIRHIDVVSKPINGVNGLRASIH